MPLRYGIDIGGRGGTRAAWEGVSRPGQSGKQGEQIEVPPAQVAAINNENTKSIAQSNGKRRPG